MKTSLLTIALFATLLFWSSCKEKSTEPLSTPEVIESIEVRFISLEPYLIDTMIITEETTYFKFTYPNYEDKIYIPRFKDSTVTNSTVLFNEFTSKIDVDYFFSLDSIYHIGLYDRCYADSKEYELIINTNKRTNKLFITCSVEKDSYTFDNFFEKAILMSSNYK